MIIAIHSQSIPFSDHQEILDFIAACQITFLIKALEHQSCTSSSSAVREHLIDANTRIKVNPEIKEEVK